jgi:lysophospholipase L1-like esterase
MRNVAVVVAAVVVAVSMNIVCVALLFGGLEGFLRIHAAAHAPAPLRVPAVPPIMSEGDDIPPSLIERAKIRHGLLTMPKEWEHREIGRGDGYVKEMWHGVLQVYNGEGMRRLEPFPPKQEGVFRVMVLGDSITYGAGVAEEWTYPALLTKRFAPKVEFLNLGISGYQSEDILRLLKKYLPILKPDLVFYGVCHNDFLPSGRGQYSDRAAYSVPLPEAVSQFFMRNTLAGPFIAEIYDGGLRYLHLRKDFVTDILTDFESYQTRFARDVADMNRVIIDSGLPPMLAMVFDQYPSYGKDLYRITKIAEKALLDAGAHVILMEDYYRRYDSAGFYVSPWEGHPDERAFFVWAGMIETELRQSGRVP